MNEFRDRVTLIAVKAAGKSPGGFAVHEEAPGRAIFCNQVYVRGGEYFGAMQNNIRAVWRLEVREREYRGERIAEYKGERYAVESSNVAYRRTADGRGHARSEFIELLLTQKGGGGDGVVGRDGRAR